MQAVVTLSLKVLPIQGPKKSLQHYKWTWPDSCQDRRTGLSLTQTFSFSSWTGINMFTLSPFWGCFNGRSCYHYHKGQGFSVAGKKQQEVVLLPDSWCWTPQMLIIMSDSVSHSQAVANTWTCKGTILLPWHHGNIHSGCAYWVGLLIPLTFAWHRLSPLAAFTSSAYFLHNGKQWQWICKFYTASFKGISRGP